MTEVKGVIRIGDKYFDLETDEEIEVQTFVHETYGEVKYLNYNHNVACETCLGTGLVGGEEGGDDCTDCDGEGNVAATELVVVHNYEIPEGQYSLPDDWHEGGV